MKTRENNTHTIALGKCFCLLFLVHGLTARGAAFVDSCAPVPGDGSLGWPFQTLTRAVSAVPAGEVLVVRTGCYPPPITIQKPLTLVAWDGPVLVGGHYTGTDEFCVPITDECCSSVEPFGEPMLCTANPPGARAKVYFPAAPDGSTVACGGPFPLIVFAHGNRNCASCTGTGAGARTEDFREFDSILKPLAAAGFIVVAVDLSWFPVAGAPAKATMILNTLAFARAENARSGSRFKGTIDLARVGLAGHSTGGAAVLDATRDLTGACCSKLNLAGVRLGALALLAPAMDGTPANFPPTLVLFGTSDVGQVSDAPLRVYAAANGAKHLVSIRGANHYGYSDSLCCAPPGDGVCSVGGVTGSDARQRQQLTAQRYLQAFFSNYLQNDTTLREHLLAQEGERCSHPGNPPACGTPTRVFADLAHLGVQVDVCSCVP